MQIIQNILSYPINKWIIWVGAGISHSAPSSLPLGQSLTQFALEKTCGAGTQKKIFEIWQKANKLLAMPSNDMPINQIPRLESILDEIDDIELKSKECKFKFNQGFKGFLNVPYNRNHFYLASLLLAGATIVTTNFDNCIQQAYMDITKKKNDLLCKKDENIYYYKSKNIKNVGKIWHIHGIADDVNSLGVTIKKIKEGLSVNFQKILNNNFKTPTVLIFLGYSASDSFDVNLYFNGTKSAKFKNSSAVFIQHGTSACPPNALQILKRFGSSAFYNADITKLLHVLSGKKRNIIITSKNYDWEKSFLRHTVLNDHEKLLDILVCKISNMLGINTSILKEDAYQNAKNYEKYFDKTDFNKTMAIVCRMKGESANELEHDMNAAHEKPDLLGYYYAQGNLKKALKYSRNIEDIFIDVANIKSELDWKTYTSMSVHCRLLIIKYLKPHLIAVSVKDKIVIKRLIELTSLLGNIHLSNVKFINQVATALRFNFLLSSLIGLGNTDEIKAEVLKLYGEGASILGYIGAYRDIAIENYFRVKYQNKKECFPTVFHFAEKSMELAKLVGDIPGQKRARKLLFFFRLTKRTLFIF